MSDSFSATANLEVVFPAVGGLVELTEAETPPPSQAVGAV